MECYSILLKCIHQLGENGGDIIAPPFPSVQFVLQMLHRGQSWDVWWPIKWDNVTFSQKVKAKFGYVGPGFILL